MKNVDTRGWQRLVSRAWADPFFLGSALATYAAVHGLGDDMLAEWLECPPANLDRLALCRLPSREEQLARDVERIAEFAACNGNRLIAALREVAAIGALRREGEAAHGSFLMAARDRKESSEDGEQ